MASIDLEGKCYIVTGASSGIGRSTAIELSKTGATVALLARRSDELEKTKLMMLNSEQHLIVPYDLSAVDKYDDLFAMIVEKIGPLNGFVHSAGVSAVYPLRVIKKEMIDRTMSINYSSFIELSRVFCKRGNHAKENCSIVAVSSIVTERVEKCQTIYAASKAAVEASVKCLSIELASSSIRVNAVAPGMIATEMMQEVIDKGSDPSVLGATSVLGIGQPEDVANSIIFLLSDMSKHITGRIIPVDGGSYL